MNKLILIIAGALCVFLVACVKSTEVNKSTSRGKHTPLDTIAFLDRVNKLNSIIAGTAAPATDSASMPAEYTELIFPEGENPDVGGMFAAVLNKFMGAGPSLGAVSEIFDSAEEKDIINSCEFKEMFAKTLGGDFESDADADLADLILEKYLKCLEDNVGTMGDIIFISNKYIELVSGSDELSDDDKDMLYLSIDIAVSASKYWKDKV